MKQQNHLAYIDAMRGIAILGVIITHVVQLIHGLPSAVPRLALSGRYGVQLFFIVSAATLFMSMESRRETERRPVLCFFIRRFFRLAPLFYLGSIFYTAWWWFIGEARGQTGWDFVLTYLFAHIWYVHAVNLIVPGGWSIGVEMNFYLLVPFLHRRIRNLGTALLGAFGTLLVAAALRPLCRLLGVRMGAGSNAQMVEYTWFWLPTQLPIFLLGFSLFFIIRALRNGGTGDARRDRRISYFLIAFASYLALSTSFADTDNFLLNQVLFGIAFVLLGTGLALNPTPLLVNKPLRWLGTVSYSAYITHFAVYMGLKLVWQWPALEGVRRLPPLVQLGIFFSLVMLGTAVTSYLSYRLLERPTQRLGGRLVNWVEARARARDAEGEPQGVPARPAPTVVLARRPVLGAEQG